MDNFCQSSKPSRTITLVCRTSDLKMLMLLIIAIIHQKSTGFGTMAFPTHRRHHTVGNLPDQDSWKKAFVSKMRRVRSGNALAMQPLENDSSRKVDESLDDLQLGLPAEPLPLEDVGLMYTSGECGLNEAPESIALSHHILKEEIVHNVEELIVEEEHLLEHPVQNLQDSIVSSWEPTVAKLIKEGMANNPIADYATRPFMVGVVGIPGSGKTTSCTLLANLVPNSVVVPMDGYHLPLRELEKFPNPKDAIYRRGAPHTFAPDQLQSNLDRILNPQAQQTQDNTHVYFPGFDHNLGDPKPDEHLFVRGQHQVVICEGIYLLHDEDGWSSIKDNFDFTIYIDADVDFCIDRLRVRNACIPGYTPEQIYKRCDEVDRVNAQIVLKSKPHAHHVVQSAFGKPCQ